MTARRFPPACTVVGLKDAAGRHHALRRRRARHHRRAARCAISSCTASGSRRWASWSPAWRTRSTTRSRPSSAAVELMLDERPDPEMQRDLEMVRREAARAGQIVRNLLSFVRRSAPDRVAADLNEIDPRHGRAARVPPAAAQHHARHRAPERGRCRCWSTAKRFSRSSLNLILNAEQAIADGGPRQPITVRSYSTRPVTRSSRSRTTAPASARSCADESSSRSSRRRTWGRARASACRFPTASRPRTAARWTLCAENRRAPASG